MNDSILALASQYELLLRNQLGNHHHGKALVENTPPLRRDDLPDEISLQCLWFDGHWGRSFVDDDGSKITILDPGEWNRTAGPDFLGARVEINGVAHHGDIELDPATEDWERHGHGANPAFNKVILHVSCLPPVATWFTRNSKHERISHITIPEASLRESTNLTDPCHHPTKGTGICRPLWDSLTTDQIDHLLTIAAAYRFRNKHQDWLRRCTEVGSDQALYERLAETLGYAVNKLPMGLLARRVPLKNIRQHPEPLLFGAAGFLLPILPERCSAQARDYHKQLWSYWWEHRHSFETTSERAIPWTLSGIRPANQPQRRLAALALIIGQWDTFAPLCEAGNKRALIQWIEHLSHPYWSTHVTLPSRQLIKPLALMGKNRVDDFIINHLFPMKGDDTAWQHYIAMPGGAPNSKVETTIHRITQSPNITAHLVKKAYRHQALLQIRQDFCLKTACLTCPLPHQAPVWQ
ncbi:MAG: DUF2851 family protein [Akkermansia sp.]